MAKFQELSRKWGLVIAVGLFQFLTLSVNQISCAPYEDVEGEVFDSPAASVSESEVVGGWSGSVERQGRQEEVGGGEDGDDGEDGGVLGAVNAAAAAAAALAGATTPPSTISQVQMIVAQVPQLINAITNFTLATNPNRNRTEAMMGAVPNISGFLLQQGLNAINFLQRIAVQAQVNREVERFQAGNVTHQHFPGSELYNSLSPGPSSGSTENLKEGTSTTSDNYVGTTTASSIPLDQLFIIRQPSKKPETASAESKPAGVASKPLKIYISFHIHPNQTNNSSEAKVILSNSSPLIKELLQGINSAISTMEGEQDEDSEDFAPPSSTVRSRIKTRTTTTSPPPPKIFVQTFPANKNVSTDQVAVPPNSFITAAPQRISDSGNLAQADNSGGKLTGRPVYWMNIYYPNGLLAQITMRTQENSKITSREEEGQIIIDV